MAALNAPLNRRLRMALIGGGGAGFIGRVHATAATLDNRAELVAGALSSDPGRSRSAASAFGISDQRAYGSYAELIDREASRPREKRVDWISIATPNFTHFEIARAALEAGFHVVCDKPMTTRLEEAKQLAELVERQRLVFALMHNYTGYPLVRQARQMIHAGELGEIQAVRVSYIQGWLRGLEPGSTPPRGAWKSDPEKAGSGSLGDIGTHAFQLARFVTGLIPAELSCRLMTCAPVRQLDDYGQISLRFENGALGTITISQITHGRLNDLAIEIDGTQRSLAWRQEDPNQLLVRRFGEPVQTYERNPAAAYTSAPARAACRLPGGHGEGFFEAFANVYGSALDDMVRHIAGEPAESGVGYPNVHDGVEGVAFVEQCLASSHQNGTWLPWTA